jgi:hypothetical protein
MLRHGLWLVAAVGFLVFVVPMLVMDSDWRKQQACARQVGYDRPADNTSSQATAKSQAAYQACLSR